MKEMENKPIPTDFLTSMGEALGVKLGKIIIDVIDKIFPPSGGQAA